MVREIDMIISYPRVVMVGGTELIFVSGPPFSSFRITPPTCYVSPNQSIHTSTNPQCSDQAPFLGSPRRKYQFCTHNPPPPHSCPARAVGSSPPLCLLGPVACAACSRQLIWARPVMFSGVSPGQAHRLAHQKPTANAHLLADGSQ